MTSASGFRKTHEFLLQSWEAMYRHQLRHFYANGNVSVQFQLLYSSIATKLSSHKSDVFKHLHSELEMSSTCFEEFMSFFQVMGQADATAQFWLDFIHRDMLHYASLFLAIRLRQFHLCTASIRKLAPIFHAMDRPTYSKLVPFHMAQVK